MRDEIRIVAVNLQPGHGVLEDVTMGERPLGPRAGVHVAEAPLQGDDLPQPLHIAACERERAEFRCHIVPFR